METAENLFKKQFSSPPDSHNIVLKYSAEHIFEAVDQQTLFDLSDTKFSLWLKIVIGCHMPARLRLRTIRNRIRGAIGLG